MFHSITNDLDSDSPDISPNHFRAFVKRLKPAANRIEITADRTDSSIYSEFYMTLREQGLTATVFILPLVVGSEDGLTWSQIREMDRAGFVIGSHSLTHAWLPDLTDGEITCELCFSKALIEQKLGRKVTTLAYPYGAFDTRVQRIARQCGYERAYTTAPGRRYPDNDPLVIKRVYINENAVMNPLLAWLAVSGFYVTTRELVLSLLPIEIPRKPEGWSHAAWQQEVGRIEGIDRNNPYCLTMR
jgi:peptidoglycan/xylan/chitin deacetylase (PgdA/CDA1 family)